MNSRLTHRRFVWPIRVADKIAGSWFGSSRPPPASRQPARAAPPSPERPRPGSRSCSHRGQPDPKWEGRCARAGARVVCRRLPASRARPTQSSIAPEVEKQAPKAASNACVIRDQKCTAVDAEAVDAVAAEADAAAPASSAGSRVTGRRSARCAQLQRRRCPRRQLQLLPPTLRIAST